MARGLLALFGWRVDIAWPPVPKCVIIVYPHTSNWDFVVGIVARYAIGFPVHWVGKDNLFRGWWGDVLRRWGGIPVNRRESTGFIGQLVAEFERRDWLWIAITPEGTRGRTEYWKSGFYHLALAADVPVGLAYIDFRRRVVGLTEYVRMTGDQDADLATIRAFYADKTACRPQNAGPIRFRDDAGVHAE
jgi:1-acyl-sn-glycerol-3-phosphate acyltransferase